MDLNRFFVGWLLVAGLVGVYAESDDEDSWEKLTTWIAPRSEYRTLDITASALNPTNEDSSAATDVFGFVNEAGSRENSNPGGSTSRMSQEDYDWHYKEGEEALRRPSDGTNKTRTNEGWLDPQMQSDIRIPGNSMWDDWYPISIRDRVPAELAEVERAVFDKREGQSITKERVPDKELNKPGPSRLETSKEKANRERLDRQMQAHGKKILDQRISAQESFVDFSKNRTQTQQGHAELAPAINAKFASPYKGMEGLHWKPEEKNIILKEFKEYIDAAKVPPSREIITVKDKHQSLRSRTVDSIQSWIKRHIKKNASPYKKIKRRQWKPEETNIILKEFKEFIDAAKVPLSREIITVRDKHQLLRSRKVTSIQNWISRHIKKNASPHKKMERLQWKPEETNIILKEFKEFIDAANVPRSREIITVRDKHQLLQSRTVASIQNWIKRHIKGKASLYKGIKSQRWKPEEKNIILEEFKEYIDVKMVPPSREIDIVRNKHQILRNKTMGSIRIWIKRYIKKKA